MPFRINHYASKVLDNSATGDAELLVTKIVMLIMLVGFGYWLADLGYFWGFVFFSIASIPIAIFVVIELVLIFKKIILWLKAKL